jgi:hypothetical protein
MPDNDQTPTGAPTDDLDLELEAASGGTPQSGTEQVETKQIPDKYRGKSVDDLIEMHQNAERRLSQQGNELGEIRRIADQLIGVKPVDNATKAPERKAVTVEALLENPDQVLNQTLETSSVAQRAQAAEARVDRLEQSISQSQFVSKFKDYKQDLDNPEFIDWVKKNPLRTQLAAAAYQNNFNAASSLWEMWDERNQMVGAVKPKGDTGRQQRVQDARTEKNGASETPPAKTYSRAKLMQLRERVADGDAQAVAKWNDPEFQAGLIKAYEENRVR